MSGEGVSAPVRRWPAYVRAVAVWTAGVVVLVALLEFLAPDLSYEIKDRAREWTNARAAKPYRIRTGTMSGSAYRVAETLNRHLRARARYELELVSNSSPASVTETLKGDGPDSADLTVGNSADRDVGAPGIAGLARLDSVFFFVIVPNDSAVREVRDLAGAVNTGTREQNGPPTLGEQVLEHYELIGPAARVSERLTIVRPENGNVADFDSGHNVAMTRTQALNSDLIESVLGTGRFRIVPIRDSEALARAISGARAGFIPAGVFGPERRIPPDPVPTLVMSQLLLARTDLPARVVRDILETIYDPTFLREVGARCTRSAGERSSTGATRSAART
jgi:TRAP-type uncharacterized transport system substrate-binding protein